VHPVRLLQHLVPLVLVEQRGVPGPRRAAAELPLDRRLARRKDGRAQGRPQQLNVALPLPHHPQLLQDLPQGSEPRARYCGD